MQNHHTVEHPSAEVQVARLLSVTDGMHVSGLGCQSRRKTFVVLGPLALLLILWVYVFVSEGAFKGGPSGKAFGADFAMFVGGAQVLRDGGNPFDHAFLYRTEQRIMREQGLSMTNLRPVVRVGNPPLFLWALEPLTSLPFQAVACAWIAGMLMLSGLGFLGILSYLGWKRRILPLALFLVMPPVFIGAFYGNVIGLVFASVGCGLALVRKHPFAAGCVLTLALLKPPVAMPVVLLIGLFHAHGRLRLLLGFALTTGWLSILTLLTTGAMSLTLWFKGLAGYSRDMAIQPDVASLAGLYVRWAPTGVRLALEAAILAFVIGLTAAWWWRLRGQQEIPVFAIGWLWCAWFLATPYAHFFDEMLLAVPVLALLGRDGFRITHRLSIWVVYLIFFSLFFLSWTPMQAYVISLDLLAVGFCLFLATRSPRYRLV